MREKLAERRVRVRIPVMEDTELRFVAQSPVGDITVQDLSLAGFRLSRHPKFLVGQRVSFNLIRSDSDECLSTDAIAVYVPNDEAQPFVGFQFADLSLHDRDVLSAWLSEYLYNAYLQKRKPNKDAAKTGSQGSRSWVFGEEQTMGKSH